MALSTLAARALARRGRPPKYGRPAQVVALTLPREVVRALERIHADLGWAIVNLVERTRGHLPRRPRRPDVALVDVGAGSSLIVIDTARFRSLPGVQIVPLSATQGFLALEPGRGLADLELALGDRLSRLGPASAERRHLTSLRDQLRRWRRTRRLRFSNRAIVLVTRAGKA